MALLSMKYSAIDPTIKVWIERQGRMLYIQYKDTDDRTGFCGGEMKRDYGTNGKGLIRNFSVCFVYFRLFRSLSSFHLHNEFYNGMLTTISTAISTTVEELVKSDFGSVERNGLSKR